MPQPSRTPHEAALAALVTAADMQTATQAHAAWFEKYARRCSPTELRAAMQPVIDDLHDGDALRAAVEAKYAECRAALNAGKVVKLMVDDEVVGVIGAAAPAGGLHPIMADIFRPVFGR